MFRACVTALDSARPGALDEVWSTWVGREPSRMVESSAHTFRAGPAGFAGARMRWSGAGRGPQC